MPLNLQAIFSYQFLKKTLQNWNLVKFQPGADFTKVNEP